MWFLILWGKGTEQLGFGMVGMVIRFEAIMNDEASLSMVCNKYYPEVGFYAGRRSLFYREKGTETAGLWHLGDGDQIRGNNE